MTNKVLLRGKIIGKGYNQGSFAKTVLGISRTSLSYKMNNRTGFTSVEIDKIIKELRLTNTEVRAIFFAPDVHGTKTNNTQIENKE